MILFSQVSAFLGIHLFICTDESNMLGSHDL